MKPYNKKLIVEGIKYLYETDAYFLDTETTGLTKDDEIVDLGMVSFLTGEVIYQKYFLPSKLIDAGAAKINSLSNERLLELGAVPILDIYKDLVSLLQNRSIISFNASFDKRLLEQTFERYKIPLPQVKWHCAKLASARFLNERPSKLSQLSARFNLIEGNHTSIGDCLATRDLLLKMLNGSI